MIAELQIEYDGWHKIRGLKARLEKATRLTLSCLPTTMQPVAKDATLTVLLTSNAVVRRLNGDYRGKDKPTNVLSFPQFERRQLTKKRQGKGPIYVGDIAMAYQYTVDEARAERKILINHVTHLMIHGVLHLFGYDHQNNAAAMRMEKLETKLMAELGLPDPYAPAEAVTAPAKGTARKALRKRT